ncbi:amidohydrolase [uncultured Jatrophihabitans sp.]|uniref:amidohydrolase n=1 Tax=uncultured Jatrophihabitans sp. TaxID=1610747 RepID=UPI0035CAAD48
MLVDGGVLQWIGDEQRADQSAGLAGVRVIDLDEALVTAAFVDAHVHATSTGLGLTSLDLTGCRSLAEALRAVEIAARAARGRPLIGGGWSEIDWPEGRPPTSAELDRASYGGVVYLARVDVHSAVVSSALRAAVPGLAGPGVGADGWIREPAHDRVREVALQTVTRGQRRNAQQAMLRRAASLGIVAVHEMAGPVISTEDDLLELIDLAADPALPDVVPYWGELGAVDKARQLGAVGAAGDLFCDGSLGSATAALREPYLSHPGETGLLRFATEDMAAHVESCVAARLQTGFHAIGDAAVDQVLDAFELASTRLGRTVGTGQRIEHAEYVRDPARLAASGLTASMQPCFDALWGGTAGMYAQRVGADRSLALNRVGDLAAAGVPLVFGSDSPVTELGPWAAVRAAAHHHDPAASISVAAAFEAHTRAGWRAGGSTEDGVLAPGRPATFAVWRTGLIGGDTGLPALTPDRPLPECLATVLRGSVLHDTGLLA